LNIEENKKFTSQYDVKTTPVVLIFKDQRMVACLKDDITKKVIEDRIEPYLKNNINVVGGY
jgi:hypothetical protein